MDPNATYDALMSAAKEALSMVEEYQDDEEDFREKLTEISEMVVNLDEWIRKGGFLPRDWAITFKSKKG